MDEQGLDRAVMARSAKCLCCGHIGGLALLEPIRKRRRRLFRWLVCARPLATSSAATNLADYIHCGRADDMLKIGGIWVSPVEVELALIAHESVLEAAVIVDGDNLIKTKAFVVLKPGVTQSPQLALQSSQDFVKGRLAPYKYPRQIEFVDALPKTATGKIRHTCCAIKNRPPRQTSGRLIRGIFFKSTPPTQSRHHED